MRREPGGLIGRKRLFRQLEDAQQGPVVRCRGPARIIDDIAFLLIEERTKRSACKDVVEAGVDLLIFPVMSPDLTAGVGVMKWFKVAG